MNRTGWAQRAVRLLAACLALGAARAEDIDLYAMQSAASDLPNVLFIIDNSGNWNASLPASRRCTAFADGTPLAAADSGSKVGIELCALFRIVDDLAARAAANGGNAVARVGVMLFNSESGAQGAYPRIALTPVNALTKTALQTRIKAITSTGGADTSNRAYFGLALFEAYRYFKGADPLHGTASAKRDFAAFTGALGSGPYNSPAAASCSRNYIIFIGNGSPNTAGLDEELSYLRTITTNTAQIPASQAGNPEYKNWADEYARALRNADFSSKDGTQNIQTFSIAVTGANSDPPLTTPFTGYYAFMNSLGFQGGGSGPSPSQYFYSGSSVDGIAAAVAAIFDQILAINSVFASASLPVSVNTQGVYKNQVFIGMFRPDEAMRTRWYGNLKQYKFAYDANADNITMVDVNGNAAISSTTGFIDAGAVSFWTAASTFWQNDPKGTDNPATTAVDESRSDLPDGQISEKGAAAQVLRSTYATSQSGRRVYTCIGCAAGTNLAAASATQFVDANAALTPAALGVSSDSERSALIAWIRGADNRGDEKGPGSPTTVRPSIHGDVLHSRPAVVDYGGTIGTVVFYGANDGTLRAVNGNQTGSGAGSELWAFVPEELLGRFKRLRENWPEIKYPNNSDPTARPRDYFVDGPITVYRHVGTGKVYVYTAMRRGGRFLYAFDVSDPAQPLLLWRHSQATIAELGQTWSEPRLARVKGNANPVIVMGAGYDAAAEDASPPGPTTMGNAVLVLDAVTGAKLKSFATLRSVPASVALVDSDYDGRVDRAYVSDIGGSVFRIDFENALGDGAIAQWTMTKIADLSDAVADRKFLFEPDVLVTRSFTAVMLGSGNRERPLLGVSPAADTRDQFFTLFDYKTTKGAPTVIAPTLPSDLVAAGSWNAASSVRGCYFALPYSGAGEKVVNAPITVGGRTLFSTNQPTPVTGNSCGNLGIARAYAMPAFCGMPTSVELLGGGLPPTPVTGLVDIGNGVIQRFLIGGSPPEGTSPGSNSAIGASKPPVSTDNTRRRVYWFPDRTH
jgi:type IV pilus assembly protein PilY1